MPKFRPLGKVESVIIFGMIFPNKIPGLRWLTFLTALYAVLWMSLEGNLTRVILMGTSVTLVSTGHLMQRLLGRRSFSFFGWMAVSAVSGALVGFGSGILTFFFMALKTGIHGHGPEFRPAEIESILGMFPLWAIAGLIAGFGFGVLAWELRKK